MILLETLYSNNTEYFPQIEQLFEQYKHNFVGYERAIDFVAGLHGHFFIVTDDSKFLGCMYLNGWDLDNKECYLGGFSVRKNKKTIQALDMLITATFQDYEVDRICIRIFDNTRIERLFLKKLGFKLLKIVDNEYIYYIERA